MKKSNALLMVVGWFLSSPAIGGVAMELVTTGPGGQEMHRTYFYAQGERIRMDNSGTAHEPEMSTIFLGNEFIVLDHEERSYFVIDQAMLDDMSAQITAAMQEMEKQLANLPPEQRAMAEQMMRGGMQGMMGDAQAPEQRIEATGSGDWQSAKCDKYAVFEGSNMVQEVCATPLTAVEGAAEAMQAFRAMSDYIERMTESLPMGESSGPNPGELLDEIDGFPVITTEYQYGRIIEVTTLESAANEDIDPVRFNIPDGYARQDLME